MLNCDSNRWVIVSSHHCHEMQTKGMTEQVYLLQVLLCHIPPLWQYRQYVQIQITGGNWMWHFLGFLTAVSLPCFGRSTFPLSRVIMFLSFSLHKFCKLCSRTYYTYVSQYKTCIRRFLQTPLAPFQLRRWSSSTSTVKLKMQICAALYKTLLVVVPPMLSLLPGR